MNSTILNISAICDKAGRSINQDNFWICPDLSSFIDTEKIHVTDNEDKIILNDKGALLVVADGMGGMNAGEVASQIVIDSIKKSFSDLKSVSLSNPDQVKRFIKQSIVDADIEIKEHAKNHPETMGMGSTIVLLWIIDKSVYVGWCGDSRAYCYNAHNGLIQLTHDHSYVQELVDNGKLSEEDAFDHPDSNIITRSLGDSGEKANPDVKEYPLHKGDTFLLCSDGLCGLLRDSEIENIMADNVDSVKSCLKALWRQGSSFGWTDNTTIELAKVIEGGIEPQSISPIAQQTGSESLSKHKCPIKHFIITAIISLIIGTVAGAFVTKKFFSTNPIDETDIQLIKKENDSLRNVIVNYSIPSTSNEEIQRSEDTLTDSDIEITTESEVEEVIKEDVIEVSKQEDSLTVINQ